MMIPWNKGLMKEDPRVADNLEKRRQTMLKKYGKLGLRIKGEWKPTEETKIKMSKAAKLRWIREHDKIVESQNEGKRNSEVFKRVHSETIKKTLSRLRADPEYQKRFKEENLPKMVVGWKNSPVWRASVTSEDYKLRQGEATRIRWADPDYKKRVIKAVRKGCFTSPTIPERIVEFLLDDICPGEYSFTGDGKVVIGGLNPDFVNVGGQKKVIEVFGRVFHDPESSFMEIPYTGTEQGRQKILGKAGYDSLIIWDDELSDINSVSKRILAFNGAAM